MERVLARASELQASVGETPDQLSESELIALGAEVGLSADHLRLAIAEERTRSLVPADTGWAARLLGSATVSASRTVNRKPADVLTALDGWFTREEALTVQRRTPTRLVWEPRQDFFGAMQRTFQLGGRGYALGRAGEVSATVQPLSDDRTLVRLDANLAGLRTERLGGAGGTIGTGVVLSGILVLVGVLPPLWVIPAAISPVAAWAVARSFRAPVARAQVMLDHYLDRLEHGDPKRGPSLLDMLGAGKLPR